MEFVIITGMSGAGKTCIVDSLEDLGFFCVDNLPAELISVFAELNRDAGEHSRVAVVTDIRNGVSFVDHFNKALQSLAQMNIEYKLMFIDAEDDILIRRYKETRRPHPLLGLTNGSIREAVRKEREILCVARAFSNYYFETSGLSANQCRARVLSMFSEEAGNEMQIHFMSFGFKHGIPSDVDFVFDLRFLPNPYYLPELRQLTGLDDEVFNYVMNFDESKEYAKKIEELLTIAIPCCKKEGRTQLVVGCGCTGGHHRSVTFARLLEERFSKNGFSTSISHRDILK